MTDQDLQAFVDKHQQQDDLKQLTDFVSTAKKSVATQGNLQDPHQLQPELQTDLAVTGDSFEVRKLNQFLGKMTLNEKATFRKQSKGKTIGEQLEVARKVSKQGQGLLSSVADFARGISRTLPLTKDEIANVGPLLQANRDIKQGFISWARKRHPESANFSDDIVELASAKELDLYLETDEQGQELLKRQQELKKKVFSSSLERTALQGVVEPFLGEKNANRLTGSNEEDKAKFPEANFAGQVAGELGSFALASKIPGGAGLKVTEKSAKLAKTVDAALKSATLFGKSEIVKEVLNDNTLADSVDNIVKGALTGAAFGGGLSVIGQVVGGTVATTAKTAKFVTDKIMKTAKNTKAADMLRQARIAKVARLKNIKLNDVKVVPGEFIPADMPIAQEIFDKVLLSESSAVGGVTSFLRMVPSVLNDSKAFMTARFFVTQEAERVKVLTQGADFAKKWGKILPNVDRAKITDSIINLKPVILTADEAAIAADAKKLFESFKPFVAKKLGIEVGQLPANYVPRYYKNEIKIALEEAKILGLDVPRHLESVFGKPINPKVIEDLLKPRGTKTTVSGRFKARELSDEAADEFINKDINYVLGRYINEMAKEVADGPIIANMEVALKAALNNPSLRIPEKNVLWLNELINKTSSSPLSISKTVAASFRHTVIKSTVLTPEVKTALLGMGDPFTWAFNTGMRASVWGSLMLKGGFAVRNVTQQSLNLLLGMPLKTLAGGKGQVLKAWGVEGHKVSGKTAKWLKQSAVYESRNYGSSVAPTELAFLDKPASKIGQTIQKIGFYPVTASDRANVQTTLIAARRWAENLKMPKKMAIEFADDVAALTQFLYFSNARAMFSKTLVGRPLYLFKSWGVNYMDLAFNGRKLLYTKYASHLPKPNVGEDVAQWTIYLAAHYGAVEAMQGATNIDLTSSRPHEIVKSALMTPIGWAATALGVLPGVGNALESNDVWKIVPGNRMLRWMRGDVDSPFGMTPDEGDKWKKYSKNKSKTNRKKFIHNLNPFAER